MDENTREIVPDHDVEEVQQPLYVDNNVVEDVFYDVSNIIYTYKMHEICHLKCKCYIYRHHINIRCT